MKAILKYQIVAIALMVGLGLTSFSAEAQHNNSKKESKKEYKYSQKENKKYNKKNHYYSERDYRRDTRFDNRRRFDDSRFVYHHPRYGNVYKRFYETPMRLKYAKGDVYYHGGHYYRYYPRVGYVQVAIPSGYVFVDLPGRYERVNAGGHLYFKVGDLTFERCDHGYRLAPHISLNLSARF